MNKGITVGTDTISCLAYADDIVIMSDNEQDLQAMLNTLHNWCGRWQLIINADKSNVVHFRRKTMPQSKFSFKMGDTAELKYTSVYKYLGVVLDEHFTCKDMVEVLANSAGRALGGVISKLKEVLGYGCWYIRQTVPQLCYPGHGLLLRCLGIDQKH